MELSRLLTIGKALGDATRLRALAALAAGELCLCQIVDLFRLAPSTLSRHMQVLGEAGLVERRKQGRWHYFRLAGDEAPDEVRRVLDWVVRASRDDPAIGRDAAALKRILAKDPEEISACYRS